MGYFLPGLSTGALRFLSLSEVAVLLPELSFSALELSALEECELSAVLAFATTHPLPPHTSIHAPAKGVTLSDLELTTLLDQPHPVVFHPYVASSLTPWSALGDRLLLENSDWRKVSYQDPSSLRPLFDALPEARLCLDVSHALSVGGVELVEALLTAFSERVGEVHVGCASGLPSPLPRPLLLQALRLVRDALSSPTTLVLEPSLSSVEALTPWVDLLGEI